MGLAYSLARACGIGLAFFLAHAWSMGLAHSLARAYGMGLAYSLARAYGAVCTSPNTERALLPRAGTSRSCSTAHMLKSRKLLLACGELSFVGGSGAQECLPGGCDESGKQWEMEHVNQQLDRSLSLCVWEAKENGLTFGYRSLCVWEAKENGLTLAYRSLCIWEAKENGLTLGYRSLWTIVQCVLMVRIIGVISCDQLCFV
eukprot:1160305-Pelagomonas_calceolata.AAC.7